MAVKVMRRTASCGLRILGSGTVSTCMAWVPHQQTAFIGVCPWDEGGERDHEAGRCPGTTPGARGLAVRRHTLAAPAHGLAGGGGGLAGLHDLLEAAQVLAHL